MTPWRFDLDEPDTQKRLIDGPEKQAFVVANSHQQASMLAQLHTIFRPSPGRRVNYLDKSDLQTLSKMGWWIGAHSLTHASLPNVDAATQRREILGSLTAVRGLGLQRCSSFFAYPDGAHDAALITRMNKWRSESDLFGALTVKAVSTTPADPLYALPRYIPPNDSGWGQTLRFTKNKP